MNGHDELMNADAVYDAELVEEPLAPVYTAPRLNRFTTWWLRTPRVPLWLKSGQQAKQAATAPQPLF